jgi:hypothetical protein
VVRAAATRCRQKKKQWVMNLETKALDLQRVNVKLEVIIMPDLFGFLFCNLATFSSSRCRETASIRKGDDGWHGTNWGSMREK